MARIRTIKPDFWTDEKLTECSLSARLLFIGMLNFADDNGNLVASAKKLKMQIFPADNIECQPLLDELITHGILIEYSVSGDKYLNIKGFKKHQVINRPSKSNIPEPQLNDGSVSAHAPIIDGREGKGREVKALSGKPDESPVSDAKQILEYLNLKAGRQYRPAAANTDLIAARLKDGITVDQCKSVIDAKVSQWGEDDKMREYLRPGTLFNRTKFEQYLGQLADGSTENPFEDAI